jgi:hypothetical protein
MEHRACAYIGQPACQAVPGGKAAAFLGISRENVTAGSLPVTHCVAPYYCIARGGELWFERLDFDAF